MQKALAELESMNLIYTERTNGKYVTNDKEIIEKAKKDFSVCVKTNQDNSNLILSTVEQVFTQNDFSITNESSCRYNVFIDIDFNKVILTRDFEKIKSYNYKKEYMFDFWLLSCNYFTDYRNRMG